MARVCDSEFAEVCVLVSCATAVCGYWKCICVSHSGFESVCAGDGRGWRLLRLVLLV